jgi:hypothetical protein
VNGFPDPTDVQQNSRNEYAQSTPQLKEDYSKVSADKCISSVHVIIFNSLRIP